MNSRAIDWQWKAAPLDLLRKDPQALTVGAAVVSRLEALEESRPFHWLHDLIYQGQAIEWALSVLSAHVKPGDNAPEILRPRAKEWAAFLRR